MTLSGPQQGKVYKALLDAFKESELRRLLRFELDRELAEIAGGEDYRDVVDSVVSCSCTEGWHLQLIQVACAERPNCPNLRAIAQEFLQQPRPIAAQATKHAQFPDVCDFDLRLPVRQAIAHLDDKSGLIGLAIPAVEAKLLIKLCERLKKQLGRRETLIRDPLKLDYRTSVERVCVRVQRYRNNLNNGRDVICPIDISDASGGNIEELWDKLFEHFQEIHTNNRLVMLFHGSTEATLPTNIRQIQSPSFDGMDVRDWVLEIAEKLNWQEDTWRAWRQCMIDYSCKDGEEDALDAYWVYEHLDFSMKILQRQTSEQEFLQELLLGP